MRGNILVVDDEAGPRESLRIILKQDHNVRVAASGPEALAAIEQERPDLVFLDLRMPGMDGTEVLREIKTRYPEVAVAIITAYAAVDSARMAVRYGAIDYLIKPYSVTDVERIVERALEARRHQHDTEVLTQQLAKMTELLMAELRGLESEGGGIADTASTADPALHQAQVSAQRLQSVQSSLREDLDAMRELSELGEAAAEVIHDINNLLTIILTNSQYLLMQLHSQGEYSPNVVSSRLSNILQAAEECSLMSRRVKEFMRLKVSYEPAPVNLNDLVVSVVELHHQAAQARQSPVQFLLDLADVPTVQGEELGLRTVLANLVENSLEALVEHQGPEPPTIEISTRCTERDSAQGQMVMLSVRDNGRGMSPEVLQKATQAFFSAKAGLGTGLGLSIVERATKRHGGHLHIESEVGKGTTVTIALPIEPVASRPAEARPPQIQQPHPIEATARGTIILVDDDSGIREVMASVLEANGYQTLSCGNGTEGWALFQRTWNPELDHPLLVITDHEMPGMLGRELARRVKEMAPQVPVMVVSGYLEDDDTAVSTGPEDVLIRKPFDVRSFLKHVHGMCGARVAQQAS